MNKIINLKKSLNRRIYRIAFFKNKELYDICIVLLTSSFLSGILGEVIDSLWVYSILCVGYIAVILGRNLYISKYIISPYKETDQFIGLYSIEGSKPIHIHINNGLISRVEEIAYLFKVIEDIFNKATIRPCVCITGKSGCGKSTILHLFEKDCQDKYKVYNFSDKYSYLEDYVTGFWGKDYKNTLLKSNMNVIIIFDQFERFFSLNEIQKESIYKLINDLAIPTVAMIFSIREEFFLPFVYWFNVYNLRVDKEKDIHYHGIMSYKDKLTGGRINSKNVIVCLDDKDSLCNNKDQVNKRMKRLCQQAFGTENGELIYNKFNDMTLIQQQIIFNVIKNEQDSSRSYMDYIKYDINNIMKRYFDVQLCSTDDFFNASRIMYLLSLGRINNISFTNNDLMNAFFISEDGNEKNEYTKCLEKLHDLELIRKLEENSKEKYEISHDYIAKSFEIYASTEMSSSVKAAIDEYKAEYVREVPIENNLKKYRKKRKENKGTLAVLGLFTIIDILLYFFYGKYMSIQISLSVLIISIASLIYVFTFFYKITRFYEGKYKVFIKMFYIISMLTGMLDLIFYDFWLGCLGIGNMILGLSCVLIGYDNAIASKGKKMFLSYGLKTMTVGALLLLYVFSLMKGNFISIFNVDTKFVMQVIPMSSLLLYAYFAHLNEDFLYAHLKAIFSYNG